MDTTVEYAETHFAQLLRCVERGEEVILRAGANPVARLVPVPQPARQRRPQVGEITSGPIRWDEQSFAPLDEEGMKALGLL